MKNKAFLLLPILGLMLTSCNFQKNNSTAGQQTEGETGGETILGAWTTDEIAVMQSALWFESLPYVPLEGATWELAEASDEADNSIVVAYYSKQSATLEEVKNYYSEMSKQTGWEGSEGNAPQGYKFLGGVDTIGDSGATTHLIEGQITLDSEGLFEAMYSLTIADDTYNPATIQYLLGKLEIQNPKVPSAIADASAFVQFDGSFAIYGVLYMFVFTETDVETQFNKDLQALGYTYLAEEDYVDEFGATNRTFVSSDKTYQITTVQYPADDQAEAQFVAEFALLGE